MPLTIESHTIMIAMAGAAIGQVNGLSLIELGGLAFARPSRITARVRLGGGTVVDIEREVELGGPIHSKGVLILSGFLAGRYVPDHPLSLSASIVFEQSYGAVEGDSASSAELYALLSALADVPIKQSIAVTGKKDARDNDGDARCQGQCVSRSRNGKRHESFVTEKLGVHLPVVAFRLNQQDDGIAVVVSRRHGEIVPVPTIPNLVGDSELKSA